MNKYEIIDPFQINEYAKKGYEFVTLYTDYYHSGGGTMTSSGSINGTLNGANVNLNLQMPVGQSGGMNKTTKFLMKLTPQAEVLFGDRNENKPAST